MRTSTNLFLGALLLCVFSLGFYDLQLRAGYRKGDYRNPYFNYKQLPYRDFDEIELVSSTTVPVTVERGDFKVLAAPTNDPAVVRQEGRKLIISAEYQNHYHGGNTSPILYISCPTLSRFVADAEYTVRGDTTVDQAVVNDYWMPNYIKGFRQDSLVIQVDHATNLELAGNTIRKLVAGLGGGAWPAGAGMPPGGVAAMGNGPLLTIGSNNQFDVTDFHVLDQGRVSIKGTGIRQLTYTLADGASLTVNGVAARYLNLH